MLLAVQGTEGGKVSLTGKMVPASDIARIFASAAADNSAVARLDYAAFTDLEPENRNTTLSGFATTKVGVGVTPAITIEFRRTLTIASVYVQAVKAATAGGWGVNYIAGARIEALVGSTWEVVYTIPSGLAGSSVVGPDGLVFNESRPNLLPVNRSCSAIRIVRPGAYVAVSTFMPIFA